MLRRLLILLMLPILAACAQTESPEEGVELERPPLVDEEAEDQPVDDEIDPIFEIEIDGAASASLDNTNATYSHDYEEPTGNQANESEQTAIGFYTMTFQQDDAETINIIFADTIQTGTYPVGARLDEAQMDASIADTVTAAVLIGDTSYNSATDGQLVFEEFGDNRVAGEIELTLEADDGDSIELTGTFGPLPLNTDIVGNLDTLEEDANQPVNPND